MNFFSLGYFLFICIFLCLYYGLRRTRFAGYQWVILLAASLLFYICWDGDAVFFIIGTSLVNYLAGRAMESIWLSYKAEKKTPGLSREEKKQKKITATRKKRVILILALLVDLGILAWLKYWNVLFSGSTGLLLPLGISFYTFSSIAYIADIYNDKYPAEKNFPMFLLFVSWFPQLLQGPIGRYDKLRPQFTVEHIWDRERVKRALLLILFGFLKKYAIADMLSGDISAIFDGVVTDLPGSLIVFGILLYSAQQYADFSGGIDIVLGVSQLFGIELAQNFRQPYFSISLGDFWRRWHISLGAFMRDYVFYPFALLKPMQRFGKFISKHFGKRAGSVIPASIANLLVFFLVGIWHGAEMHYVWWGLYNGLVIALSDITAPLWNGISEKLHLPTESKGFHVFRIIRTFVIVNIGWYFDRIYNMENCLLCLKKTVREFDLGSFGDIFRLKVVETSGAMTVYGGMLIATVSLVIVFAVSLWKEKEVDVYQHFMTKSFLIRGTVLLLLCFLILGSFVFTESAGGFLYANF